MLKLYDGDMGALYVIVSTWYLFEIYHHKVFKINKIQKETDDSLPLIVTNFTPRAKYSWGTNHKTKIISDILQMLKEQAVFDLN